VCRDQPFAKEEKKEENKQGKRETSPAKREKWFFEVAKKERRRFGGEGRERDCLKRSG